jgi:Domain of unknown function (DUF1905)
MPVYELTGEVWRYPGKGGWHFVTLPAELADELRVRYSDAHRAFGSLRVTASLGSSTWSTSLFTDTRSSSYVLPVKAEVRRRERIHDGDTATILIELED